MYSHEELTRTLRDIVDNARHVSVNWDRIPPLARHLQQVVDREGHPVPPWAKPDAFPAEFPASNTVDTLQYFFVMIPQGYEHHILAPNGTPALWSMWIAGQRRIGVHAQYACATRALDRGMNIRDAEYLVTMTLDDVHAFYRDEKTDLVSLSDMPGRLARFHEVGRVLLEHYDGHYANLLREAEGYLFRADGGGIVQRLVSEFPRSYGDWPFCKLSVTPARMLYDRRRAEIPTHDEYLRLTEIRDPDHFEAGADVARPFALIRLGILEVSTSFEQLLTRQEPVDRLPGVYDEARAASILVCRELVRLSGLTSPEIGDELWSTGFYQCPHCRPGIGDDELACSHKPACRAYQIDHELFRIGPMVGTGD